MGSHLSPTGQGWHGEWTKRSELIASDNRKQEHPALR